MSTLINQPQPFLLISISFHLYFSLFSDLDICFYFYFVYISVSSYLCYCDTYHCYFLSLFGLFPFLFVSLSVRSLYFPCFKRFILSIVFGEYFYVVLFTTFLTTGDRSKNSFALFEFFYQSILNFLKPCTMSLHQSPVGR